MTYRRISMPLDERIIKIIQKRFRYTDEQLKQFLANPRNEEVMQKIGAVLKKVFVLTVIESNGCNTNHKVGDKIYLDGCGNILTKHCPEKICTYALHNAILMIFAANEFLYNDLDPNKIKFNRCSCFDVGVSCGGLGKVVLELNVVDEL